MEDLHKVIRNIKSIHNPTCLETISKFNHDNWVHDFCTLPFTEKINYDTTIKFLLENYQKKRDREKFRKACEKVKNVDVNEVLDELYLERKRDEVAF